MLPIITPPYLQPGDKIAMVSPATRVRDEYVEEAYEVLRKEGWNPYIAPHAIGNSGSFSASLGHRLDDLKEAFMDDEVKAVFCNRGGYGCVQLLEELSTLPLREKPKWVIGFSDVTALHALMQSRGIKSLHSSMAKHLSLSKGKDICSRKLFEILKGKKPAYRFEPHKYNRSGLAEGRIVGGNLAVMTSLISTPFDMLHPDTILFIEDIAEPIYKVERMLYQLKYSGVLGRLKGLIVGRFTSYDEDMNHADMESMIAKIIEPYSYPVAFDISIGHIDINYPMIENSEVRFTVSSDKVDLEYS